MRKQTHYTHIHLYFGSIKLLVNIQAENSLLIIKIVKNNYKAETTAFYYNIIALRVIIFPRNASFWEYYVFVSNAAAAAEGFKLHSSDLTHALLIQISRTSSIIDIVVPSKMIFKIIKIRMDLKWPEKPSKVNFGHPKWPIEVHTRKHTSHLNTC